MNPTNKFRKISGRNNLTKTNILEKITRGSCQAETSPQKRKQQNSKDPCGMIRDITAHLIHDKNTSIAETCIVFNELRIIDFLDPGDFGPGGRHRPDPEVKIQRSKGLNPSFYVVVYGDLEKRH